jgi:hypothetical protein
MLLRTLLLVIHITAAAVSFGAPLGVARLLRLSAHTSLPSFGVAVKDVARRVLLARIGGVASLFSGVVLVFLNGGFGVVTKNYHVALALMWLLLGVQFFVTGPAIRRSKRLAEADVLDPAAVLESARRVGLGVGAGHALWTMILVLMFERF